MGKTTVDKKKKHKSMKRRKKGRPSLLDLQKRSLKNEKPNSALELPQNNQTILRRSTRRNPIPSEDEEDDELPEETCRDEKRKLVVEFNADTSTVKKRKINAGSEGSDAAKAEKVDSGADNHKGSQVELGPLTPLADKALLLIILQRLQKLDKYGVFSEPVDPEELPDYHDIIEHPMDFATVRKKLEGGAYANLEQFEKDVFLICSNAMQYNASDTIYFRQARSIQDLAKKSFENLRQDSDDNEVDGKTTRRGRPPAYYVKKTPGKSAMENMASEANSNTVFVAGGESRTLFNNDMRRGSPGYKTSYNEGYRGCTAENRWDKTEGYSGSPWKYQSEKYGKKLSFGDDDRRNTYLHPHSRSGSTVLTTLGGERKQLVAVGHFSGHGYARSLALFAAKLGPVAWKCASKKIERSLPGGGIRFGPGWVGENDVVQQRPTAPVAQLTGWLSPLIDLAGAGSSSSVAETSSVEYFSSGMSKKSQKDISTGKKVPSTEGVDINSRTCDSPSAIPSCLAGTSGALESTTFKVEAAGSNSPSPFNSVNESASTNRPNPSLQIHQSPSNHPHPNAINGFKPSPQLTGQSRPFETSPLAGSPKTLENRVHTAVPNIFNHEDTRSSEISRFHFGTSNSQLNQVAVATSVFCPNPSSDSMSKQSSDTGLQPRGQNSVPPDLNVRFQSPGSPSSCKIDSVHPDLALQL